MEITRSRCSRLGLYSYKCPCTIWSEFFFSLSYRTAFFFFCLNSLLSTVHIAYIYLLRIYYVIIIIFYSPPPLSQRHILYITDTMFLSYNTVDDTRTTFIEEYLSISVYTLLYGISGDNRPENTHAQMMNICFSPLAHRI